MIEAENTVDKRVTLFISTMASFLTPYMSSAVNIALPAISKELTMNTVLLNWVAASFLLASAVFLVPFGRIADIYGRKRILLYGISTYTFSSLLVALSNSAAQLIAARVLQGVGGAMIFGTGVAILTSVFPAQERGKALGINAAAIYFGLSSGPFLGGFLTQNFGWRSIFLINLPLGLLVVFFILWKLKGEWADEQGERFDLIGSVIYGLSLLGLMYGFSLLPSAWGVFLIFSGLIGVGLFGFWQTKTISPIFNISLFRRNRILIFSSLAALINYSATFALGFLLSLYLQYIKGLSPQVAGVILVAQPLMQVIFSPLAGRLSDRFEPRLIASLGMTLTVMGLFLFSFLSTDTALGFIIGSLLLLGVGFAFFSAPNTNAIMGSVDRRYYGVASGILGTMRLVGQVFSMGIAMLVFIFYIGRVRITPEHYPQFLQSVRTTFLILTALCFAGIFASLARGKTQK